MCRISITKVSGGTLTSAKIVFVSAGGYIVTETHNNAN